MIKEDLIKAIEDNVESGSDIDRVEISRYGKHLCVYVVEEEGEDPFEIDINLS